MPQERAQGNPATGAVAFFTATGLLNSDPNILYNSSTGLSLLNGIVPTGPNGETGTFQWNTELLTLSTGGLTTDTTANLLPAGSLILAVVGRVTTTITTATSWGLSDPTTANRFAATNSTLTAGTTSIGIVQWSGAITTLAAGPSQAAAAKVRVTCVGSNPGAGVVRVGVLAFVFGAATS
jgi:hypothetical protein